MWRLGLRSGRVEPGAKPRDSAGHRGAESRGEVAVPEGRGALRADPGTRPETDRLLVFPEKRAGDLHVLIVQHRRGRDRK